MTKLILSENLKLPETFVTETCCIFGKRGSGKSSTGARMAEQLAAAGIPFAVLDVPDVWWGLKSSKDGKSAGLPVYVFGGRHADLPLESGAGSMLADVIVDHRINVVMSLRHFSNRERTKFVAEFAEQLFKRNSEPLMLFCEEAHRLMPQDVRDYERGSTPELMLGRMVKLHTEGRTSGIGLTCITQRPALLHKTATTQSEILIAHRILGPQDTEAIRGWIKHHDLEDQGEVLQTLPTLRTGECWVWAPGWPEEHPVGLRRVQVLMPETFDSRRTPKPGEQLKAPKALAPVDLEKLRGQMAATIERAKADDPKELRRRIAELGRELRQQPKSAVFVDSAPVEGLRSRLKEANGLLKEQDRALRALKAKSAAIVKQGRESMERMLAILEKIESQAIPEIPATESFGYKVEPISFNVGDKVALPGQTGVITGIHPPRKYAAKAETNGDLTGVQQRILDAIAELETLGISQPPRVQVALLSDYTNVYSKGFANAVSSLSTSGHIVYPSAGSMALSESGRKAANWKDSPRSEADLHQRFMQMLGGVHGRILTPLIRAYPKPIQRDELGAMAGYGNVYSKGFANAVSRLSSLGLVEYPSKGLVKASSILFFGR